MQEPNSPICDASHDQDLAQSSSSSNVEAVPIDDQGQLSGQDGDTNDQDDQVIPPRCNKDMVTQHKMKRQALHGGKQGLVMCPFVSLS